MLTAETESGQLKGHNYWNKKRYGPMHLNFLSEHRASLEPAKIHRRRDRPSPSSRSDSNRGPTPRSPSVRSPNARSTESGARTPRAETQSPGDQSQPYVTVRTFTLSHEDEPFAPLREITQLQYMGWPDLGAPAHPAHLLGLVEQCDAVVRAGQAGPSPVSWSRSSSSADGARGDAAAAAAAAIATAEPAPRGSRPVVVHCSAGCGRTGTFCTVDSVVDILKRQRRARQQQPQQQPPQTPRSPTKESGPLSPGGAGEYQEEVDLVERVVRDFRAQRLSMVQNLRQFVLCYESVLEWLATQVHTPRST